VVIVAAVVEGADQAVAMEAVVGAAVVAVALMVPRDHREPATHRDRLLPAGQEAARERRQEVLAAAVVEAGPAVAVVVSRS
jgi:hypothetical protein